MPGKCHSFIITIMTPLEVKEKLETTAYIAAARAAKSAFEKTMHAHRCRVKCRKNRNPRALFAAASAGKSNETKKAMWEKTLALIAAAKIDALTAACIDNNENTFAKHAEAIYSTIIGKASHKAMVDAFETAQRTKQYEIKPRAFTCRRTAVYVYEKARLARQKALKAVADNDLGGQVDIDAMKSAMGNEIMPGSSSAALAS